MIFNKQMECAALSALKDIQSQRLQGTVDYIYKNSPVFQKKFDLCHVAVPPY